jgi:uncharacterized protein (TIGR03118 family)
MMTQRILRRLSLYGFAAGLILSLMNWSVRADHGQGGDQNEGGNNQGGDQNQGNEQNNVARTYHRINLVSNLPHVAILQDTNLVNAWGMSFSSTSPFWISDNGTGLATLYDVTYDSKGKVMVDKRALEVTIPPAGSGTPSGQVFAGGFDGEFFIFVSEDGTISGWHGGTTVAETLVAASDSNVYKGVTLAMAGAIPVLLAANFRNGTIDEYDATMPPGGQLTLMGQFHDPTAPAGYAPFNVMNLGGMVFVTFAKQDAAKHDDVAGRGNGLIDMFNPNNNTFTRFATGTGAGGTVRQINSPWGMAMSPSTFGIHANQLLVGNFGSGTIMSFDAMGQFMGLLRSSEDEAVAIDGLWGLAFGNGGNGGRPSTLYFTAGPDHESNGLFGSLDPVMEDENGDND